MITNIKNVLLKDKKRYLFANNTNLSDEVFIDKIANFLQNGIKVLHFKPDNKNDTNTIELCLKLRQLVSMFEGVFLIEQRADIAKIVDADGIILKNTDIAINQAKKIVEEDKIICSYFKNTQDFKLELFLTSDMCFIENNNQTLLNELLYAQDCKNKIIYTTIKITDNNFIEALKYENNI